MTKSEIKSLMLKNYGLYPVQQTKVIKRLIAKGFMPDTERYMRNNECDLRSLGAFQTAYYELQFVSRLEITCAV
jgi:hypothetical protein